MDWKEVGLLPVLSPGDTNSPIWEARSLDPCSSPCAQLANTLALPAASAEDPVSRTVRNRRRINPLGTGPMGWSRFSTSVRWTLGSFFT